ncbi:MAG: dihydroorotate dehydrogenase electron transfer subunit [Candidatus Omnitrophica bacterium]|nr:dihydroorotate dehydrogenase electron transfer subunit [Candidatus Omnitrophota bacterium]
MKDIRAKILQNKKVCGDYYKMALDAPYIAKNAKPGQFVQVRCSDGTEPLLRRPFSVHKVKGKTVEILYEIIGQGTEILSERNTGETLDVLGPLGNGFTLSNMPAVIIAGGIGVAPLVFLAEELAKKKIKAIVLIGAKTKNMILCEKDFKNTGAEVKIATDDGSKGCKGFVSNLFEKAVGKIVYACGPAQMLKCVADMCKKKKMHCEISLEEKMACGIGACLGCAVKVKGGGYKLACKDGPVFNIAELI